MISRADMAARGAPRTTVGAWYRDRARTGYPEKAGRIGRTDYWYEDDWTAWREAHLRGKVESLTQVDRSGDPDDLVDATEAARMLRYANRHVIHANRRLGYFPEPDAYGKAARAWAAAASRAGHGVAPSHLICSSQFWLAGFLSRADRDDVPSCSGRTGVGLHGRRLLHRHVRLRPGDRLT